MALTNYYAIPPTIKGTIRGTNSGQIQTGTSITTTPQASWAPGDYCFLIVLGLGSVVVDPSSVVSNGINFTKMLGANGQSFWYALNNTANTFPNPTVTVTYAVSQSSVLETFVVQDATAIAFGAGVTSTGIANGSTIGFGTVTPGASTRALVIAMASLRRGTADNVSITYTPTKGTPASIAAVQDTNGTNSAGTQYGKWFVACSHGEDIDTTNALDLQATAVGTLGGTMSGASIMVYLTGRQVALDDLTFKIGDSGTLLNQQGVAVPFYDVDTVAGLSDMDVTNSFDPVDGTDGSYPEGQFLSGKTVVIDGTIYGSAPFDEALIDALKTDVKPVIGGKNFYFKWPNKNPRRSSNVVPVALKADVSRSRTLQQVPFQIQLLTPEAFFTDLDAATTQVSVSNVANGVNFTVTPGGTQEAFPTLYFNSTSEAFAFFNNTWIGKYPGTTAPTGLATRYIHVDTTLAGAGAGLYKLDFKNRRLLKFDPTSGYGIDVSFAIDRRDGWWTLIPGVPNALNFQRSGATDNVMLSYRNTWT